MISATRRKKTAKVIKKRIIQIKKSGLADTGKALTKPNKLADSKAFGCHRSHCRICHREKYKKRKRDEFDGTQMVDV